MHNFLDSKFTLINKNGGMTCRCNHREESSLTETQAAAASHLMFIKSAYSRYFTSTNMHQGHVILPFIKLNASRSLIKLIPMDDGKQIAIKKK